MPIQYSGDQRWALITVPARWVRPLKIHITFDTHRLAVKIINIVFDVWVLSDMISILASSKSCSTTAIRPRPSGPTSVSSRLSLDT